MGIRSAHLAHHTGEKQMHQQLGSKHICNGAQMMDDHCQSKYTLITRKEKIIMKSELRTNESQRLTRGMKVRLPCGQLVFLSIRDMWMEINPICVHSSDEQNFTVVNMEVVIIGFWFCWFLFLVLFYSGCRCCNDVKVIELKTNLQLRSSLNIIYSPYKGRLTRQTKQTIKKARS